MRHLIVIATFCLNFGISNANAQVIYLSCSFTQSENSRSVAIDLDTKTVEMDELIFPESVTTISASSVTWKKKNEFFNPVIYQVSREDLSWSVCFEECSYGKCEVAEPPTKRKVF